MKYAVSHGGLFWNVKFETDRATQLARLKTVVENRAFAVFSEACFYSFPTLVKEAKLINPDCQIFVSVNGWGCYDNGSIYWPTHKVMSDIVNKANTWLNDINGNPIRTPWAGNLRLFDIRFKETQDAWIDAVKTLFSRYGVSNLLFVDEAYRSDWVAIKCGYPVNVVPQGNTFNTPTHNWDSAQQRMYRLSQADELIVNGTTQTDSSAMITGRYFQNAYQKDPASILSQLKYEHQFSTDGKRKLILQTDGNIFWQALAQEVNGYVQDSTSFSDVKPMITIADGLKLEYDIAKRNVQIISPEVVIAT